MKKILLLAALVVASLQLTAANVDLATAKQSAQRFLMSQAAKGHFMASNPTIKWTHEVKNSSNVSQAAYYIVNTDNGYVIVAGDDRAKDILAYGEGTLESINDLPEAVQYFLDIYHKQMEFLQTHPGLVVKKTANTRGISVEPMLKTTWGQDKPYNMRCPKVGTTYCKVGCTAVALAQVMKYWEYPEKSPALPGYQFENLTIPALPEYTFDWGNMRDSFEGMSSSAIDQLPDYVIDAIGYLMRYVGQAEQVDYGTERTGTQNFGILQAINTFGFDPGVYIAKKYDSPDYEGDYENHDGHEFYTDAEWGELIQAELRAGRPLVYCAYDMSSDSTALGGHAFNVDGYDAETDMYHVNFGLKSERNGYYAINAFQYDFVTVYDFWPIFFAGVQPPGMVTEPRILVSQENLSMECYVDETTASTFTVVGERLSGDITVTLDDANGVFTADAATIAVVDSAANVTVTVTYAPKAVGTHNATITLSSDGIESKVVTLKGTATAAPLVVYDPVMQPANEEAIRLTSFRADWTDQTAAENVASYTLEVREKPGAGGVIAEADWSDVPSNGYANAYLPEGWEIGPYNIYNEGGCISITSGSYIRTNALDLSGFDKVTVVFAARAYYSWSASEITIKTSVDSKYFELNNSEFVEYTAVLDCTDSEQIEFFSNKYYPTLKWVKIYAGEVEAPQLRATESGDATYRLITGITDKFYTVNNLTAEGTFLYKVKALYNDGTESVWSNTQEVTLFDNEVVGAGDVNMDSKVSIADVTALINYLLSGDASGISLTAADVNADGKISIADVTELINILLSQH